MRNVGSFKYVTSDRLNVKLFTETGVVKQRRRFRNTLLSNPGNSSSVFKSNREIGRRFLYKKTKIKNPRRGKHFDFLKDLRQTAKKSHQPGVAIFRRRGLCMKNSAVEAVIACSALIPQPSGRRIFFKKIRLSDTTFSWIMLQSSKQRFSKVKVDGCGLMGFWPTD